MTIKKPHDRFDDLFPSATPPRPVRSPPQEPAPTSLHPAVPVRTPAGRPSQGDIGRPCGRIGKSPCHPKNRRKFERIAPSRAQNSSFPCARPLAAVTAATRSRPDRFSGPARRASPFPRAAQGFRRCHAPSKELVNHQLSKLRLTSRWRDRRTGAHRSTGAALGQRDAHGLGAGVPAPFSRRGCRAGGRGRA
jgi:hypothetical protein